MPQINYYSFYSLFHHDLDKNIFENKSIILNKKNTNQRDTKNTLNRLGKIILELISNIFDKNKGYEISLTLTGGMDSRLILACLLNAGVKPNCMVYGNPESKDVVYSKKLAEQLGLKFHNAVSQPPDKDWYYQWVVETIKRDNGNSHLHRAHRTAAIAEHAEMYQPKVLFTGHMGGEGIRGLTYNNYFASPFFEWVNEEKKGPLEAAKIVLKDYFLKTENIDFDTLINQVAELPWMKHDKELNKFYFLYGLVGDIHHAQDIRLYQTYVEKVVPFFLQEEYLEALFNSKYHFLARSRGFMGKLRNPWLYCKLIEQIYPPLLDFPLANGFSPREYLKGLWYYVPVKVYRDFRKKDKYPPSFSYGKWYQEFVQEHALNISPEIWEIYDKKRYFEALGKNEHRTDEGYWHKFSNPIYFDLVEKYKKAKL